jgi:hypothetical protein
MSSVNDQVTDSVSQINALLTGSSAGQSLAMLDVAGAETLGMSMFNAITAQQNSQTSSTASATATCARILQTQMPAPPKASKEKLENELLKIQLAEEQTAMIVSIAVLEYMLKNGISKGEGRHQAERISAAIDKVNSDLKLSAEHIASAKTIILNDVKTS